MDNRPIGVFDSGVGGLSILQGIHRVLPHESTIYLADQAYLPYGEKTTLELKIRAKKIVSFLLKQNIKLVVIACNTATVNTISSLRQHFDTPFVGTVPAVKPASQITKTGEIVILATQKTTQSKMLKELISQFAAGKKVHVIAAPELAGLIEAGKTNKKLITDYLKKLFVGRHISRPDVMVLGCTHYPFVANSLKTIFPQATLLQPAIPIARHVKNLLGQNNLLTNGHKRVEHYFTTGQTLRFAKTATKLLKKSIKVKGVAIL